MIKFELEKLTDYSEEMLINEIRRVVNLLPDGKIGIADFDRLSKVHSSTLRQRFGGWDKALEKAGFGKDSMLKQRRTKNEIIEKLQSIAKQLGRDNVTQHELAELGGISSRPIKRLFGSYRAALEAAGFSQNKGGLRYTDEECFENLLNVWTVLGRQPACSDMKNPPSYVGLKAYIIRWGSWRKALAAFVEVANDDDVQSPTTHVPEEQKKPLLQKRTSREIGWKLRYRILQRDRFRCCLCGRSPSTHPEIVLHADHILAWANGGETTFQNLRTLCNECNIGKGTLLENSQ